MIHTNSDVYNGCVFGKMKMKKNSVFRGDFIMCGDNGECVYIDRSISSLHAKMKICELYLILFLFIMYYIYDTQK